VKKICPHKTIEKERNESDKSQASPSNLSVLQPTLH
jgi:hypothetical protein